jgi:hypothetical protein
MYSLTRLRTSWLAALPAPSRAFLLVALIPMALPVVTGAALGSIEWHGEARRAGTLDVDVPIRFWRLAPDGVAPVVKAPWGETVQPATVTVLRYTIYNPYEVGLRNSARFLDWQIERAIEKVYREPATPSELATVRRMGLPLGTRPPNVQVLCLATIILLALGAAWCEELSYRFRLQRFSLWRMLANALQTSGMIFFIVPPWPWLLSIASYLPHNPAIVTAIAAVPVLLLLLLLDWQFRHSDQPPSISRPRA